jgi:hypothetical protein
MKHLAFMQPEYSLPCSQECAIDVYPEPHESNLHSHTLSNTFSIYYVSYYVISFLFFGK